MSKILLDPLAIQMLVDKGGGDGFGCTKAGKGVKIMVDARGLTIVIHNGSASTHESPLS